MYVDSSFLQLLPSASGGTVDLLGLATGSAPGSGLNPVGALAAAEKNQAKGVAAAASAVDTKRDVAAFRAAVAKAKSPAALLADPVARKVLLTANGLGDQTNYPALATKALLSNTKVNGSLASKLTDPRWLSVAKTYDFANRGLAVLRSPKVLDSVASAYAEVQWRTGLDQQTPGLSLALDFRARAGGISSVDQVLGDANLRKVVTTTLGIPEQIAFQDLRAQEVAITSWLDLTQFKKAAFVEQFARRFLVASAAAANAPGTSASGTTAGLLV